MPADPEAIRAQFEALKAVFLQQLPARLEELEAAWNQDRTIETHRLAHRLAGTAGTFGASAVSTVARAIEHLLNPVREGAPLQEEVRREVEARLRELRSAAQP